MSNTSHDPAVEAYYGLKGDLETMVGGLGKFQVGLPGDITYPIQYNSQRVPDVTTDANIVASLTGAQPHLNLSLSDADRKTFDDKRKLIDEAGLHQRFFEIYHPFDDPIRRDRLREIWPEPFERYT